MSLVDHLLASRTPLELAKLAASEAKDNARLRDELSAAKHELFWMKVAELNSEALAAPSNARAEAFFANLPSSATVLQKCNEEG
jgi:hypothetical protein